MPFLVRNAAWTLVLATGALWAQQPAAPAGAPQPTTAAEAPTRDTSYIDDKGTAHVTRVVPVPQTISPQAQLVVGRAAPDQGPPESLEQRRRGTDEYTARARVAWTKLCPNTIVEQSMAGVPVRTVTPEGMPESNKDKVLLNLHGGGFTADSGSYTESIPIASYSKIKVVAVLYRLAPEHPFPAAVDDSVAVYKELLRTYKPNHIAIYGTSAGAILTAQVAAKLKQSGLPLPAALGIFSGNGDFAQTGDSLAMYALRGLSGHLDPPEPGRAITQEVRQRKWMKRSHPCRLFIADLHGAAADPCLSRADATWCWRYGQPAPRLSAGFPGVDAQLVVYDGLSHAFWYDPMLPEAQEANHLMADFFVKQREIIGAGGGACPRFYSCI